MHRMRNWNALPTPKWRAMPAKKRKIDEDTNTVASSSSADIAANSTASASTDTNTVASSSDDAVDINDDVTPPYYELGNYLWILE